MFDVLAESGPSLEGARLFLRGVVLARRCREALPACILLAVFVHGDLNNSPCDGAEGCAGRMLRECVVRGYRSTNRGVGCAW